MSAEVLSATSEKPEVTTIDVGGGMMTASYPLSINDIDTTTGQHIHSSSLIFHITRPMDGGNLTGKSLKSKQDGFLKSPQTAATLGMIQMHMPAMVENVSHNYASGDTTVLNDLVDSVRVAQSKGGDSLEKFFNGSKAMAERTMGRIVQSDTANQSVVMETGEITKQRSSLLYNGTALRTHTFSYSLRPRSVAELKHVGEIIYMFRMFSSGSRGVMSWLKKMELTRDGFDYDTFGVVEAPPIWFVEERVNNPMQHRSIDKFMFGPAVVTGVRVNKTPDQIYQTIAKTGGDPVEVELEITMQEMIPTYSDFWRSVRALSYKDM
ncbi:MAG: baseplate tail-tube junction protein [Cetobacterium sp.]|uniref:baseplate tail-tube junction protein n=1 Tax=Cetobacterium sp. TaxID=2071632 RepID=UPI003EE5804D